MLTRYFPIDLYCGNLMTKSKLYIAPAFYFVMSAMLAYATAIY